MSKLAQNKIKITITNPRTNQPPAPNATRVEAKSKVTVPYNSGMYPLYAPSPVHTKLYGSLYTPVLNFLRGGGREKRAGGELLLVVVVVGFASYWGGGRRWEDKRIQKRDSAVCFSFHARKLIGMCKRKGRH